MKACCIKTTEILQNHMSKPPCKIVINGICPTLALYVCACISVYF